MRPLKVVRLSQPLVVRQDAAGGEPPDVAVHEVTEVWAGPDATGPDRVTAAAFAEATDDQWLDYHQRLAARG